MQSQLVEFRFPLTLISGLLPLNAPVCGVRRNWRRSRARQIETLLEDSPNLKWSESQIYNIFLQSCISCTYCPRTYAILLLEPHRPHDMDTCVRLWGKTLSMMIHRNAAGVEF